MSYISQSLESDPHAQSKGSNSVVIEVSDPQTHGVGNKRYTDYLVKTTVSNASSLSGPAPELNQSG